MFGDDKQVLRLINMFNSTSVPHFAWKNELRNAKRVWLIKRSMKRIFDEQNLPP